MDGGATPSSLDMIESKFNTDDAKRITHVACTVALNIGRGMLTAIRTT